MSRIISDYIYTLDFIVLNIETVFLKNTIGMCTQWLTLLLTVFGHMYIKPHNVRNGILIEEFVLFSRLYT